MKETKPAWYLPTTTTMFHCLSVIFLKCCVRCKGTNTFQKGLSVLTSFIHRISSQTFWGSSRCFSFFLFCKCETRRAAAVFILELQHVRHLSPVSFLLLNHELWPHKWELQFFRCCFGLLFYLLDEVLTQVAGDPLFWRSTAVSVFLLFRIMALFGVCWSPKVLEMVL